MPDVVLNAPFGLYQQGKGPDVLLRPCRAGTSRQEC